jgi:hypothetical protein
MFNCIVKNFTDIILEASKGIGVEINVGKQYVFAWLRRAKMKRNWTDFFYSYRTPKMR